MPTKSNLSIVILTNLLLTTAHAEIITDGTLSNQVNLPGPHFQIDAQLGQQFGANLFHSFQAFNLQSHESATFSGPANVSNIISRVTGGYPSNIDGLIRSTIPNADLYFLNPYGILFGPNAKLDLQGGFHASTADYLRLQDGGRFEARYPNNSLLTVAPVAAFGFLTDSPAPIETHSSKLLVLPDQTLSLMGGNIYLTSEIPLTADNSLAIPEVVSESLLATEHGRINLASLASQGEIVPSQDNLVLQGQGGKITIENTLIENSGYAGGATFIRAGEFFLNNAVIRANTFGPENGKDINIQITKSIHIDGVNSEISMVTASTSNTGNISVNTPYLEINSGAIFAGSAAEGEAGTINIDADEVVLNEGGSIGSGALAIGRSGNLTLNVSRQLSLLGFYPGFAFFHSQPFENNPSRIWSICLGTGQSGHILINTKELDLDNGNILANGFGAGQGGDIVINVQTMRLLNGGTIASNAYEMTVAGNIKIQVADKLYLAGYSAVSSMAIGYEWGIVPSSIDSGTSSTGKGGNIGIQASEIILTKGGTITARSTESDGDAGSIAIEANTVRVTKGGMIATSAEQASGGEIQLTTTDFLYLQNGEVTTSVMGGAESGGNISIGKPQFVVLNQGQIKAQADEGHGGNIRIVAEQFIPSADSLISASSQKGVSGEVMIQSPENSIGNNLVVLEMNSLKADQVKTLCGKQKISEKPNRFMVTPMTGNPPSPDDDWQSSSFKQRE